MRGAVGHGCVRVPVRHEALAERESAIMLTFRKKIRRLLSSSLIHNDLLMLMISMYLESFGIKLETYQACRDTHCSDASKQIF